MELTGIRRIDSFEDINITCNVWYPRDDTARIMIEYVNGTNNFTLWRNCTTEIYPEPEFTTTTDLEDNFVSLTVVFPTDPAKLCNLSGTYACLQIGENGILQQTESNVNISGKGSTIKFQKVK